MLLTVISDGQLNFAKKLSLALSLLKDSQAPRQIHLIFSGISFG